MNINQYLTAPYIDGGRDLPAGLDCWGLVRHVLHYEFNQPLFDEFGCIDRHQVGAVHQGFDKTVPSFKPCIPKAGAVACCFLPSEAGDIFHHAGVCINDHQVLHTSNRHGVSVLAVRGFKRLARKVGFYEYVGG
ncbi:MAG: hypothetical protein RPR28_11600 [Cycloclasticus sp.]|jgi:hypothetical protein